MATFFCTPLLFLRMLHVLRAGEQSSWKFGTCDSPASRAGGAGGARGSEGGPGPHPGLGLSGSS